MKEILLFFQIWAVFENLKPSVLAVMLILNFAITLQKINLGSVSQTCFTYCLYVVTIVLMMQQGPKKKIIEQALSSLADVFRVGIRMGCSVMKYQKRKNLEI